MLPKVIIFDNISLDGRIDGFDIDNELYYNVANGWSLDSVLMSNNALLKKFQSKHGNENKVTDYNVDGIDGVDNRLLLVVPDNQGKIRIWDEILKTDFFRDILVLCSRFTSQEYLDFLEERYIKYMIIGYDEINLGTALEELNTQFGVKNLRVESGGKLNGLLLRDESC